MVLRLTGRTMSPLDLLRRATDRLEGVGTERADSGRSHGGDVAGSRALIRAGVHGVVAALLTLVPVGLLASLLWLTTADIRLSWAEAAAAGASFWLLAHGIPILLTTGVLGIVPLAAFLGVLLVGVWSAGRSTWAAAEHGWRPALRVAGAWMGGYALVILGAGGLAVLGPMDPAPGRWALATVLMPALMGIIGMVRTLDHDDVDEFLERCFVPAAVRRGWRPAIHATVVLLVGGTLAAATAVALSLGVVLTLHASLRPGVTGGTILVLLQLLALPNLGLWSASFVAGPGFSVVEGASVTWDGSSTSLVPMIPVLAAHPDPALFPAATPAVAILLVLLGGWLGWQSLAATARLASLRAKSLTVISAALSTGTLVALLDWVGGGALGMDRLASIGAPALLLGVTVTGWLLLGGLLVLLWDWRTLDV